MKKFVSSAMVAFMLSAGFVAAEGVTSASNASIVSSDDYGPVQADVKKTVRNIAAQIADGDISGIKAGKLIQKLRQYRKAGLISNKRFHNLRDDIKDAV